jgi:hypothetical protein
LQKIDCFYDIINNYFSSILIRLKMTSVPAKTVCGTWEQTQLSQTTCVRCEKSTQNCTCARSQRSITPSVRHPIDGEVRKQIGFGVRKPYKKPGRQKRNNSPSAVCSAGVAPTDSEKEEELPATGMDCDEPTEEEVKSLADFLGLNQDPVFQTPLNLEEVMREPIESYEASSISALAQELKNAVEHLPVLSNEETEEFFLTQIS